MAVDFKRKYTVNFSSILASMIAEGTPYAETISFLSSQFDQYNLTDEYKVQLQSQLLSNMTISFTNAAMQTAITVTDKEIMSDLDYDNKEKQGELIDQQVLKLVADTDLVSAQEEAITRQVIDNRNIKIFDGLLECYGTTGAGGLTVSADMWSFVFKMASSVIDELKTFKGMWDATVAFPTIASPAYGDYVGVSVTGTTSVDGFGGTYLDKDGTTVLNYWKAGDIVMYDGNKWKKSQIASPSSTTIAKVV